ncbi:MAG: UDP-N-acetylmuramate dehydrogenase [Candidatus Omnitrophica bacterium]|nr:UDP-N-acetylmuramate dehydrogenase [Candidatus Omnitrophota bacterium]
MNYQYGKLLSHLTTLKIGGPVFCFIEPENFDEVLEAINVAESNKKELTVIGNGSNILFQDRGFDGVVMNLGKGFDFIERDTNGIVRVGSASPVSKLVTQCAEWNLGGCEFLLGIPGSLGGALFMNAGVRGLNDTSSFKEIKDIVLDIDVLDLKQKKKETLKRYDVPFAYRSSGLDGKCILGARIKLEHCQRHGIDKKIDAYLKKREWIQCLGFPSAGSVFRNPSETDPAAKLIENCGFKGRRIGGAEISKVHANFIVNVGGAMSKDVLDLIGLVRKSVKDRFGVDLELELRVI